MNKKIIIPILNNEYHVTVCWGDLKYIKRVIKDAGHTFTDEDLDWATCRGRFFSTSYRQGVIALPHKPKTGEEIGTLTHEAVHAVFDIFEWIEEKNYDEVFAHSVGAIVREALQ